MRVLTLAVAILGLSAPAFGESQIAGPAGWTEISGGGAGVVASYHLAERDGAYHQVLNAVVYSNYPSLDVFIAKNEKLLKTTAGIRVNTEKMLTVCGSDPAWEVEYTHPGTVSTTRGHMIVTRQVVTVKAGYTYIATYIRGAEDPERPDAGKWIHGFCKRVG